VVERYRQVDDEQAQPVQARNMKKHNRTTDATSDLNLSWQTFAACIHGYVFTRPGSKAVRCVNSRTLTLKQVSVGCAKRRLMSARM
jgi:hypothetical protein